ncbi:siderophore biosynthesis protein [Micromonospora sp. NIE111]|nr:siderophore biosynthesis protein [Micromonospora hortensis]
MVVDGGGMRLYLTALNPTDAVLDGFLPAAASLGLSATVLTDRPAEWPADVPVARCAVRDPAAVVAATAATRAVALLSNSDHLQEATAIAARKLGLPGKDPDAARLCKDKAAARRAIAAAGLDLVRTVTIDPDTTPDVPTGMFPAVVKPREGVASEDAYLVADHAELVARVAEIRGRRPDVALVVEEYLDGELRTFETLGDGAELASLGGWRTGLGPPPTFTEESLAWSPPAERACTQLRARLDALGVGFGACHTEYVVSDGRVRLIEVNYRLIGDRMDLILADLLGVPLFEYVIRLHLGEPLAALGLPDTVDRYAHVEYVCADRSGRLVAAPGPLDTVHGDVRLGCRPLREVGRTAERTGTNRDYLAVLHGIGPDEGTVRQSLTALRNGLQWTIVE